MNNLRLRSLSAALLALLAADALSAAEQPAPSLLGALRIESLSSLANNAAGFAEKIKPGSGLQVAMLPMMAANFGISINDEILLLVLDPAVAPMPIALVIPSVDPEALKKQPGITFEPVPAKDGVFLVTPSNGQQFFGAFVEKRLVLAPVEPGLDAALAIVRSGVDPRGLRAAGGHIGLSLATARLYSAYKPVIDMAVAGMGANLTPPAAGATVSPTARQTQQAAATAMLSSATRTLADLDELTLRIDLSADHLDTRTRLQARPGSQLATLLSPGRASTVPSLAAHDPAAVMHGYLAIAPDSAWWTSYLDFTKATLSGLGLNSAESAASLEKTTRDVAATWDGTMTFDMFRASSAFSGASIIGVKDADHAFAFIRSLPDLQKSFASMNEAQGFTTDLTLGEPATHAGARLIEGTQTYRATTPAGEQAIATLKKMGMERIASTYAVTDRRLIYTMGENSTPNALAMVDAAPATSATQLTPATYALPADANLFFTLSLPRYAAWITKTIIATAGATPNQPTPASPAPADTQPGLAIAATVDAGSADIRSRLLTSDIAATVAMFAKPTPPKRKPAPAPRPAAPESSSPIVAPLAPVAP